MLLQPFSFVPVFKKSIDTVEIIMADEGQTRREMPCLKVPNPASSLYDHQVNNLHANPVMSQLKQTYTPFPKNVSPLFMAKLRWLRTYSISLLHCPNKFHPCFLTLSTQISLFLFFKKNKLSSFTRGWDHCIYCNNYMHMYSPKGRWLVVEFYRGTCNIHP